MKEEEPERREDAMMDLSEFVTQTLRQVMKGVADAQVHAVELGARINYATDPYGSRKPCDIEFDVALTTVESGEASGGVVVLGLGGRMSKADTSSVVSRVKFTVPLALPHQSNEPEPQPSAPRPPNPREGWFDR